MRNKTPRPLVLLLLALIFFLAAAGGVQAVTDEQMKMFQQLSPDERAKIMDQLSPEEQHAWGLHEEAARLFYDRKFQDALRLFQKVKQMLPEDLPSAKFIERCKALVNNPPPPDWTGAVAMTVK